MFDPRPEPGVRPLPGRITHRRLHGNGSRARTSVEEEVRSDLESPLTGKPQAATPSRYPELAIDLYANGVYHTVMEFIETPTFTRLITDLLTDNEYRLLQNILVEDPERGALIRGGGGIRKLRYALAGGGKSGGIRVIYYWVTR